MADLDTRVRQMLDAPAGCAFLLIAAESGFTPEQAASPEAAVCVGAWALDAVEVWKADHEDVILAALERGREHAGFAREILAHPNAEWWFGPMDPARQVWLSLHAEELREYVDEPGPPGSWDCYPQRPLTAFQTTTLHGDVASFLALCELGFCDYGQVPFPLSWWRLEVRPGARIFEVDGPDAWHTLCTRYPLVCEPARHPNREGQLVPHWQAVAADWDAVHLTFGGLLTSEQVWVESPAGASWQWGWFAEQTLWLRWMFDRTERLPDRERHMARNVTVPRLASHRGAMLMRVDDSTSYAADRARWIQDLLRRRRRGDRS